jgi:outer membrane murein-binding lipoprotein Lpp
VTVDPILAALARLEAGQKALAGRVDHLQVDVRDRFDRLEGKVDKLAADLAHLGPRVSQMETDFGGQYVRSGTANNRLDALDVRVGLIERRLELRDQPLHPKAEGGPQ